MSTRYKGSVLSATAATNSSSTAVGIWRPNEVMQGVNAGLWPIGAIDPYFENVTLLLHGDGTNGTQNNTFLDSSSNAFSITRNGNTTQGSFTPYGSNWSNSFSGSGQYLTLASNAAFDFGSGNFTVEFWINTSQTTSNATLISREWGSSPFTGGWSIQLNGGSSSAMTIYWADFSTSATFMVASTTAYRDNNWHHVAWVRSGSSFVLYLDGVSVATATNSTAFGANSNQLTIANDQTFGAGARVYAGNISNMRIVKGVAVYTGTFTPSFTPLTATQSSGTNISAITGTATALLTCQSNRFIDNSTNAFSITRIGTPSIQRFSPFSPFISYSTSVIGGSGYFDGTGDYLITPTLATIGLGDFSQEAWVYAQANTTTPLFWDGGSGVGTFLLLNGATSILGGINGAVVSTGTYALQLFTWTHLAYCRSGTTLSIFANGARIATGTVVTSAAAASYAIGIAKDVTRPFTGFMSGVRFVHGASAYDATLTTLTVPTAPVTAITNTTLLLSYTNAGIYDNAMMNDLETVGDAQVSTTQVKFGTGSMKFDGTGDWLTAIDTPNLQMGSGDFTIEGWIYLNAIGVAYGVIAKGTSTTGWGISVSSGNKLTFAYTATSLVGATSLAASTWYYFAVVRSGTATGNLKIYLNGSVDATSAGAVTDDFNQTNILYVGASRTGAASLNGYLDDLRVTKGYARTITTPTAAFPNQ